MGKVFSPATPKHEGGCLVAADSNIDSSSKVEKGSSIAPKVIIESNCQITGSIIGRGAKIGADCKIIDSIIAPNTQISAGMIVNSNYLGF
jgi:mannose-1-phosphate guanylyltransferase